MSWTRFVRRPRPDRRGLPRPALEALEARTVPTVVLPAPGHPGPVVLTGTGADTLAVRLAPGDPSHIQFTDNYTLSYPSVSFLGRPQPQDVSTYQTAALADVTEVDVGGGTLLIDDSNGLVADAVGLPIIFDGGAAAGALQLRGDAGAGVSEVYTPGAGAGSGVLRTTNGAASQVVRFTTVTGVSDFVRADSLTVEAGGGGRVLEVQDGAGNFNPPEAHPAFREGDPTTVVRGVNLDDLNLAPAGPASTFLPANSGEPFAPIDFAYKSAVTVRGGDGNDEFLVDVKAPAAGLTSLTLDGGAGANSASVRTALAGVTLTEANVGQVDGGFDAYYVQFLYATRLGRAAAPNEVALWAAVRGAAGQAAVANGIEASWEAQTDEVKAWYRHYLGREAAGGEERFWVAQLQAGAPVEQELAGILASPEFAHRAAALGPPATADEQFVRALYRTVLNREADTAGLAFWENVLASQGTQTVARGFLASDEFRGEEEGRFRKFLSPSQFPLWLEGIAVDPIVLYYPPGVTLAQIRGDMEADSGFFLG